MARLLLFYLLATLALSTEQSSSCDREIAKRLLETAADAISKTQATLSSGKSSCTISCCEFPLDCAEVQLCGKNSSGIYSVWPKSKLLPTNSPIDVYCDMTTDGGGWTVFQRRGDYGRPQDYFYQDWQNYKEGFGSLDKDFWLGNDKIAALTNQKKYSLRVDLQDLESEDRNAVYDQFWIEDEYNNYILHVLGFTGTAGDSLTEHNLMKFTTKDRDNDGWEKNCAVEYKGAWWYTGCHVSSLNGLYLKGPHESYADGIEWNSWKGYHYSLPKTEMKIRPLNFKNTSATSQPV